MPFCTEYGCKEGTSEGDVISAMKNPMLAAVVTAIQCLAFLGFYGGFTVVNCYVFFILHSTDFSLTPPITPTRSRR